MTACIRREGSVWTNCQCDPCRIDRARLLKMRRWGRQIVKDNRPQAWERVERWVARGYTKSTIATLAGFTDKTAEGLIAAVRDGRRTRVNFLTAEKILAAPERATDGSGLVGALPVARRLQALTVMGWSMRELSDRCGIDPDTLTKIRNGRVARTHPKFAAAVGDLYDQLGMTQGPGKQAATRAKRRGWLPPLAWEDIDDPAENPMVEGAEDVIDDVVVMRLIAGESTAATRRERRAAAEALWETGSSDADVAARIGVNPRTVMRWRHEAREVAA